MHEILALNATTKAAGAAPKPDTRASGGSIFSVPDPYRGRSATPKSGSGQGSTGKARSK